MLLPSSNHDFQQSQPFDPDMMIGRPPRNAAQDVQARVQVITASLREDDNMRKMGQATNDVREDDFDGLPMLENILLR